MIKVPLALTHETIRRHGDAGRDWLDRLPELVIALLDRWAGVLDGPATHGAVALVLPVRRRGGSVALKVSFPGPGHLVERRSLAAFDGSGTVRLESDDDESCSLLLEWAGADTLASVTDTDAATALAGRLGRRLAVPSPGDLPRLADAAAGWRDQLVDQHARERGGRPLPARVLGHAMSSIDALAADDVDTLTHGDLHFGNVLRADREPWLAVDPMAYVGSVAYEAGTIVRERMDQLLGHRDPGRAARRRLAIFSDAAEVDLDLSLRCAQARLASSYYWERQHGRDLTTVRRLHDLAIALTP